MLYGPFFNIRFINTKSINSIFYYILLFSLIKTQLFFFYYY